MHKDTPTDDRQSKAVKDVFVFPSTRHRPYPIHRSSFIILFRQPWCRCCYPRRLIAKQSGDGLIMDKGCHFIDRIDYLFGRHAENRCELCAAVEDRMRRRIRGAYFIAVVKYELDIGITASRWKFSTARAPFSLMFEVLQHATQVL